MELLIAAGVILFIWNLFSKPSNSKPKSHKSNSSSYSKKASFNSGQYQGGASSRSPYVPISESSSGISIKSDAGYKGPYVPSGRRKSDFNYPENPNPQEFLVYFIASEELGALKIGVGTSGRVLQLLSSTIRSDEGFENVGWRVLRTAAFSYGSEDYESGRDAGYEAERRVLYYWRKHLKLSAKVSERDMGWAELDYLGRRGFHLTKGFTETVDLNSVCESSSWKIVMSSPGYLGEGSSFHSGRPLRNNSAAAISGSTAPGYSSYKQSLARDRSKASYSSNNDLTSSDKEPAERTSHSGIGSVPKSPPIRKNKPRPKSDGTKDGKFWARVKKNSNGCWDWIGSISTDSGYATMLWEGTPKPAHRVSWQLRHGKMPTGDFLMNVCGQRACVNPDHWELKRMLSPEERTCLTENCDGISVKKMVDGYCTKCERRREYEYRKTRPNPFECTNPKCSNPSGTIAFASLCMSCRRKEAKGK